MDERVIKNCLGKPVPEWDMAHRLSIYGPMGPVIEDFGSIFTINSTFMDVIEPTFLTRQWVLFGALMALIGAGIGPYWYWLTEIRYPDAGGFFQDLFSVCVSIPFLYLIWRVVPGYVFGLRYRPIRLNRDEKKIYAIRSRRSLRHGEGDLCWEAPWNKDAIYCLHREKGAFGTIYHIRHYDVDESGNVVRAFSIGREWTGRAMARMALAQWNFFCKYMNAGPHGLPQPMLFHTRNEGLRETFLFSLYSFGLRSPIFVRVLMMPAVLLFTALRFLANATCRAPVWPPEIEKLSVVSAEDPYEQPRGSTPVGWGPTIHAQLRGDFPLDAQVPADGWTGTADADAHANSWLKDPGLNRKPTVGR